MIRSKQFLPQLALVTALVCSGASLHAATIFDLTTKGATATVSGATYTQMAQQPTGTGFIDPFVRVGMQGAAGEAYVQGYNTTVDGVFNNSSEDNYNRAIQVGDVGVSIVGGKNVMRFVLDINQTNDGFKPGGNDPSDPTKDKSKLNLDDVQIFISTSPNQSVTTFDPANGWVNFADAWKVYRMDGDNNNPDNTVTLDYALNSGSGTGDMYLDVPVEFFVSAFEQAGFTTNEQQNNAYIYLYSKFGSDPYNNNDGFEEWTYMKGAKFGEPPCTTPDCGGGGGGNAPEPGSMALAALGLAGILGARRRRKA